MKVLGITAEYNPFHKGHKYHLEQAKAQANPDVTVAVISGNFTQRGQQAVADKWERSQMAIEQGADLVVELPFVFACNRAEVFASRAVDILLKLGATDISFGCEKSPDELKMLAGKLVSDADAIESARREIMALGYSYAKAGEMAVRNAFGDEAAELISSPNNILAVEYMKQLCRRDASEVNVMPVLRFGSGYKEKSDDMEMAGATKLRQMLAAGEDITRFVPEGVSEHLGVTDIDGAKAFARKLEAASRKAFEMLKSQIITKTANELAEIYCIGEGFENKLKKEIVLAESLDDLVECCTSKRYTASAVRRMLTYVMLGVKESGIEALPWQSDIRLLAANEAGRTLMKKLRDRDDVNVITNINKEPVSSAFEPVFEMDNRASDVYNLAFGRNLYKHSDKVRKPFIEKR